MLSVLAFSESSSGFADPDSLKIYTIPRFTIKSNPFGWIGLFKRHVSVVSDIRINPVTSLDVSLGWYTYAFGYTQYNNEQFYGPRVRLGIKHHIKRDYEESNQYIGFEGLFNYNIVSNYRSYTRQGDSYSQYYLTKGSILTYGGGLKYGYNFYLGEKSAIILEPFAVLGVSVSHSAYFKDGIPEDAVIVERPNWIINENLFFDYYYLPLGKRITPYLRFGFNVGFAKWDEAIFF